jgi:hypothetical protein
MSINHRVHFVDDDGDTADALVPAESLARFLEDYRGRVLEVLVERDIPDPAADPQGTTP